MVLVQKVGLLFSCLFFLAIEATQCCEPPLYIFFVPVVLPFFSFSFFFVVLFYPLFCVHCVYCRGRVRTKTIKRSARKIIEKYYNRLTLDFDINKRVIDEVAIVPTKRMRNKIAGFLTHLMRRIQRGPVRGISLKLQEEEREKKLDYVPDQSFIEQDSIEVDQDTKDLLDHLNIDLPAVSVAQNNYYGWKKARGGKRKN